MGTTLTGKRVQNTYDSLLKIGDNDNLTGTAKRIGDGLGNDSPIFLSTTKIGIGVTPTYEFQTNSHAKIGGNLIVGGNLTVNGTTTIIDSTVIAIGDNMMEMAKDNVSNTMDIGWYGTINESGEKYVGVFYDASTGVTTPEFHIGLGTVEPSSTASWTTKGKLVIGALDATTGVFSGQVTIPQTPSADTDAASKKYVDDSIESGSVEVAKRIEITVKNISGGSLSKGTIVHASPSATPPSGNVVEVIAADYDDATKMPGIGVLNETIADEAEGAAVMIGAVSGIDTSSFNAGDELFVGNNGAFTNTKPTANNELIQKIAIVLKVHASNGSIKVFGAGRVNDVPNQISRNVNFTDDSVLSFGNDIDLNIYHASATDISFITRNGTLDIRANDLRLNSFAGESMIRGFSNGDVRLYYDSSEKLTTTSTGISVTGLGQFSNKILVADGSVSAPSYSFTSDTDTGFYLDGASIKLAIGGSNKVTIATSQTTIEETLIVNDYISADDKVIIEGDANPHLEIQDTTNERYTRLYSGDSESVLSYTNPTFSLRTGEFNGTVVFSVDSSRNVTFNNNVLPDVDSANDLGSTSLRWANVWADNINGGTPVNGGGTANDVVMWSDGDTLTDAPIAISGNDATFAGDIFIQNTKKINFGDNASTSVFEIGHDGSDTILKNKFSGGHIYFINDENYGDFLFQGEDGSGGTGTWMLFDGLTQEVSLYKSASLKLTTKSSGVYVYNDVRAVTGKFISTSTSTDFNYVRLYAGSTTAQWDIYGDGENIRFTENSGGGGQVVIDSDLTVSGGDIVLGGTGRIQGIDTVSAGTDAVNKDYVDNNTVDGSGTATFLPRWLDADTIGDSILNQSSNDIIIGYDSNSTHSFEKTFATGHATGNRGAEVHFGMDDGGGNVGMRVIDSASSNASFNAQHIEFHTHEGGVSVGKRMEILSTGNSIFYNSVGIGTSSIFSGNKLDVRGGNIMVGGFGGGTDYGLILTPDDGSGYWNIANVTGGALTFNNSATIGSSEKMRISSGGTVKADAFAPLDNGTSVIDFATDNVIKLFTNSTERMRITSVGNVGIGSGITNPEHSLVVGGNIGFGDGTYNGGVYSRSTSTDGGVDENWGLEVQRTSDTDDYNTRLKYYPVNGTSRKAGIWNSRDNNFTIYSDDDTVPNVIIPTGNLLVNSTSSGLNSSGRGVIEINGSSSSILGLKVGDTVKTYLFQNGDNVELNNTASGSLTLKTVATTALTLDSSQNATFAGNVLLNGGTLFTDAITAYSGSSISVNAGSSHLAVTVNGSERMRIDSSGLTRFTVDSGTASAIDIGYVSSARTIRAIETGGGNARPLTLLAQNFTFKDDSATRMVINSSGNVGIGTTGPAGKLQVVNNSQSTSALTICNEFNGGDGFIFQRWQYVESTTSFRLDLKQRVTSGVVQYAFDMVNNGTAYNNNLVLDRGNVGIGTTSPGAKLDVNGELYVRNVIYAYAGAGNQIGGISWTSTDSGFLFAKTGNVTKVLLNSNGDSYLNGGNLIVGGTAVDTAGSTSLKSNGIIRGVLSSGTAESTLINAISGISNGFQLSNDASNNQEYIFHNGTSVSLKINSSGIGIGVTSVPYKFTVEGSANDNWISRIYNTNTNGAGLLVRTDATSANNKFAFGVYADGGYKMVVSSNGDILFGTTTKGNDFAYFEAASSNRRILNVGSSTTSSIDIINFRNPNGIVGGINTDGFTTSFSSSSDYRLKENVVKLTNALDKVSELKPSRFNFINEEKTVNGFLAHEVENIVPEAISGTKDQVDDKGNPVYQRIDQSKLIPLLVGAIQELKEEIEILRSQINS